MAGEPCKMPLPAILNPSLDLRSFDQIVLIKVSPIDPADEMPPITVAVHRDQEAAAAGV